MLIAKNVSVKLDPISPANGGASITKKNFERNLKNANDEIQRLRRELEEKNKILQSLNIQEVSSSRKNDTLS